MDLNVLASLLPPITAVVLYFYFSYKRNSVQDGLPSYPSSRFDSHTSSQRPERDRLYNFYRWLSGVTIVPSGVRARIIGFTEALYNISHIKWRTSQSPEEKIGKLVDEHLQARATKGQEEKRPFAIVTGGNAGLGYEIARVLLMADHHVILACRSERAAQSAVTRLQAVTSSDKIEFMQLDLTSFTSARAFSHKVGERVSKAGGEVGVLIHNAGVMNLPFTLTPDGFETQLQVNVLTPHLLTHLLLPHLSSTARVVFTTSAAMYATNHVNLSLFVDPVPAKYSGLGNYATSKICVAVLAREWNRRLGKSTGGARVVYAYHPGVVHTNLFSHTNLLNLSFLSPLLDLILLSPPAGVMTALHLALGDMAAGQGGQYWFDEKARSMHRISVGTNNRPEETDEEVVRAWLWREVGRMTGCEEGK